MDSLAVLLFPMLAGMIKEEAMVRVGGAEALKAAVGRGDITVAMHGNKDFFCQKKGEKTKKIKNCSEVLKKMQ